MENLPSPPPPLPPRSMDDPPPYEAIAHQHKAFEKASAVSNFAQNDPRSSSQDSLVPEDGAQQQRRKLLLVYIHGFMGAETSFRSFPAHVHNLLTILLSETHVVHTKIYPRYASRGKITIARDDFGKWIEPHRDTTTDVVLLGHSMGGLLSAEVVLAPATRSGTGPLRHRILGTINFDVPFLGMDPGIVKSGLASIFKPADEPKDQQLGGETSEDVPSDAESRPSMASPTISAQRVDTLWAPGKQDPNYNPSFANDVVLPVRKGWRNAWHFINKHSDDLTKATKKLVSSHLEFGGAMANYSELKSRYARVRALEEQDAKVRQSVVDGGVPPRARFVNYYTASTGRPKKPKSPSRKSSHSPHGSRSVSRTSHSLSSPSLQAQKSSSSLTTSQATVEQWYEAMESLSVGDHAASQESHSNSNAQASPEPGTVLYDLPVKPGPLDFGYIQDPEVKKLVQKEHERAVKAYDDALAERDRLFSQDAAGKGKQKQREESTACSVSATPRGRPTVAQKPESEMTHSEREHLRLQKERQRMEREGRRLRGEPSPERPPDTDNGPLPTLVTPPRLQSPKASSVSSTVEAASLYDQGSLAPIESRTSVGSREEPQKPKKDRMFCTLPPKDSSGERDPCWVRVFMESVDEVGAHCGLFFVDERYERLVGDVASRIEGWVHDQTGERMSQAQKW
ncbi:Putative alpha/Beta hydrolase [Septoria linicola]|uniref:Alpha/Beta hydrolase n=1 Tax=Septoria linicola TaxID=215465 RepID=A0A9Q9AL51_9PEZI|nr:putative alpha/Beta hydrolase [Septoria linicola]USW47961.1 Putative alpha/Beta hydrolase [Septoria linicola]